MFQRLLQHLPFAALGGLAYLGVELVWRGRTHWTMGVLGGLCFVLIGLLDEWYPRMPVWLQCALGALIVTALELVTGLLVNVRLGWAVWDYSAMPGNLWGQICPQYTAAWLVLSRAAAWLENKIHDVINTIKVRKNRKKERKNT